MKTSLSLVFLLSSISLLAQKGYVRTENDSVFSGYVRHYTSASGVHGLEVWKTKKDKEPRRIPMIHVHGYAIGKDTVRVLRDFKPFDDGDTYYDLVHATVIRSGKVNLYAIPAPSQTPAVGVGVLGAAITIAIQDPNLPVGRIWILERPSTGYLRAMSAVQNTMVQGLRDFFPDSFIASFEENGVIKYKFIPDIVQKYNDH